jgi:hypothetical protein
VSDTEAFVSSLSSRGRTASATPSGRGRVDDDFRFRHLDVYRAARLVGRLDAPRQLGKQRRQLGRRRRLVRQLRSAAHDRRFDAIQARRAVGRHDHTEHHRRAIAVGQQARRPLAQHGWIQRRAPVGRVDRGASSPRLGLDDATALDEEPDVGDGVRQHEVVSGRCDGHGLIEIGRPGGIKRHQLE